MEYPIEWDDLPKRDRKKKLKELNKQKEKRTQLIQKSKTVVIVVVLLIVVVLGYQFLNKKSPEEVAFEQEIEQVSLEIEEFDVEGANHISPGESVSYKTNPPTSGSHWATPADWRFFDKELTDEQIVHNLEHGGIWITYKDLNEEDLDLLKDIAKDNRNSVVISKRDKNDDRIVVASWGKMMRLTEVNAALIQKYIDTYINQSPEKLAR